MSKQEIGFKEAQEKLSLIVKESEKVIIGKEKQVQSILATWLAGGHVLLEDVPGTGKTVLAKTLSKIIGAEFGRVQFTPDLLPSDITGSTIYDQNTKQFQFLKGPLFSTFFLADEINRATPRTQSALLEAMAESQITIDSNSLALNELFFVMATQNPLEHHGTFPLPEAQLDRFFIKTSLGYPTKDQELKLIKERNNIDPLSTVKQIISADDFLKIRSLLSQVKIHDSVYNYILNIISKTRKNSKISLPASPRATLAFAKMAQAMAVLDGENFVRPSYIFELAPLILGHRIGITQDARFEGLTNLSVITKLLESEKVPTIEG